MATCSTSDLLSASQEFTKRSLYDLEVLKVALLCRILQTSDPMASCDVSELLGSATTCCKTLSMWQLSAIQTQLLCEILNGAGPATGTCISCGSGPPVAPATCDCSIYYDSDVGSPTIGMTWVWDGAAWFNISDLGGP